MAYSLNWVEGGHILYCRLEGTLTLGSLRAANAEIDHQLGTAAPVVHLIFHLVNVNHPLPSVNALRGPLSTQGRDRVGWMLFIGGSAAARFVGAIVSRSLGLRVHTLSTIEEAVEFLGAADPSLGPDALSELSRCAYAPSEPVLPVQ